MESVVGTVVGKYLLTRKLGAGGMGDVFEAEHQLTGQKRALKVVKIADEDELKRFLREVRSLARIQHPNVVEVYDADQVDDLAYMAMELLPGVDLASEAREARRSKTPMKTSRALWILESIASALEAVHVLGIVHRDLKPANIKLLDPEAPFPLVKVFDFGIALSLAGDTKLTAQGMALGTARYMSPEQAHSAGVGPATDLYALGIILFELLTGRPPFTEGRPVQILMQHIRNAPPDIQVVQPTVPNAVAAIVTKCLKKDPTERFASATELRLALQAARETCDKAFTTVKSAPIPFQTVKSAPIPIPSEPPAPVKDLDESETLPTLPTIPVAGEGGLKDGNVKRSRLWMWAVVLLLLGGAVVLLMSDPSEPKAATQPETRTELEPLLVAPPSPPPMETTIDDIESTLDDIEILEPEKAPPKLVPKLNVKKQGERKPVKAKIKKPKKEQTRKKTVYKKVDRKTSKSKKDDPFAE